MCVRARRAHRKLSTQKCNFLWMIFSSTITTTCGHMCGAKHSKAFRCNQRYMCVYVCEYCQDFSHINIFHIKVEGLEIIAWNHQAFQLLPPTTTRFCCAVRIYVLILLQLHLHVWMAECACLYLNAASNLNWWHTPKVFVVHLRLSEFFIYRFSCSVKVLLYGHLS